MKRGLLLAVAAALSLAAAEPQRLEVAPGGRYLQQKDGTPFLWIGDTAWAMFYKLDRDDIRAYLDDRQKKGFKVIQAVAYWYPHGEDGPGPHNAPNIYGHRPFEGGDDEPQTDKPLVVSGGSPDNPNDYWDHADFIVREVKQRGMYLAMLPCWGRAFINSTFEKSRPTIDEGSARVFGRFLGDRYNKEPHIIWVIGGDINPTKGVGDRLHVYRAMAEAIGGDLLMTYHPEGDPSASSSKFFHKDEWLDANGIETWKSVDKVHAAVAHNYSLKDPVKPTLFLEGAYEGGRYPPPGGSIDDLKVRRQAWQAMLAGAAGHTYGAGPVWHFQRKPRGDVQANQWKRAIQYPGSMQVASVMSGILRELQWWKLVPDQSLLIDGAGAGELTKAAARSGDMLVVYFPDASPAKLKTQLRSGLWIRPQDGSRVAALGKAGEFTPPSGWNDALLVVAKPRVAVTTDINIMRGDPDDRQSVVHLLWYLDELDLKVLVADRSNDTTAKAIKACHLAVDAYAKDHADPKVRMRDLGYPSPEAVRSVIKSRDEGPAAIIAEARRDDPRPLYILAWGSLNVLRETLRQAPDIAPQVRVLTIGTFENPKAPPAKPDWNSAGRNDIFVDERFRSMWWIENANMFRGMFHGLTFTNITGEGETKRIPNSGPPYEFLKQIETFGALGRHMTEVTHGNEWARYFRAGDTPSVLYLLDPDHNLDDPSSPNWAGIFEKPFPSARPHHWTDASWGMTNYDEPERSATKQEVTRKQIAEFVKIRDRMYLAFKEKLEALYGKRAVEPAR